MRESVAVAVVALVLLAGCGSATDPATPGTATVTPAPVPTAAPTDSPAGTPSPAPTATRSPSPAHAGTLPPGVTASGIANVSALARAHRAALEGRSYRTVSVVNRSSHDGWERTRRVVRVDGDRLHLVRRTRSIGEDRSSRIEYLGDRGRYVRCERGGETGACETGLPSVATGDAAGTVLVLLSGTESRLAGTESRLAGADRSAEPLRHRVVVTGSSFGLGSPYGTLEARNYTATALITPSGLVSEVRASYDLVGGGNRFRVTVRLEFSDLGTVRVTPPPWYGANGTGAGDSNATLDPDSA